MISPTIFFRMLLPFRIKENEKNIYNIAAVLYFFLNKPLYYVLPFSFLFSIAAQGLICSL